MVSKFFTNTFT